MKLKQTVTIKSLISLISSIVILGSLQLFRSNNITINQNQETSSKYFLNIVQIITIPVGLLATLATYVETQRWKRREYLDTKFKEFESSPEVVNVRKMLDSDSHFINLFPQDPMPPNRFYFVTDDLWAEALKHSLMNENEINELNYASRVLGKLIGDSDLETTQKFESKVIPRHSSRALVKAAIRDDFNRFLDYLQQFSVMIQSKAVEKEDLKKYLNNWALIISAVKGVDEKNGAYKEVLLKYMGLMNDPEGDGKTPTQNSVCLLFSEYYSLKKLETSNGKSLEEILRE